LKYWRQVHKWLGFIVAIQVLLWISGGVVMSVLPIEKVRGKHLIMPKNEIKQPNNVALSQALAFTMTGMALLFFSIIRPWYARVKYRSKR
jgi:uncharacterized iron-regulated membrane protein